MKEDRNYVYRGGSWYNAATHAAVAATYPGRAVVNLGFRLAADNEADRVRDLPGYRGNYIGFRLVTDGGE